MKQQYLPAGKIVSTHGLRGDVKILPWADSPEFLLDFDTVYLAGKPYTVEDARVQKTCVLMKLAGVDSVEAAESLAKEYQEDIDAKSKPTGDDAADAGAPATDAAGSTGGTHDANPPEPANLQGGAA